MDSARIARLSGLLQTAVAAMLVLLPLAVAWSVATGLSDPEALRAQFPDLPAATAVPPGKAGAVAALGALALIPAMAALVHMRGLFALYRRGEILTQASAERIRGIGCAFVVLALAGTVLHTAQVLLLTIDNPAGQRALTIRLDSNSVGFLLAGGLLVVIGWAMREAARAAEENAGFV